MGERERLQRFREESLEKEAKRLHDVSGAESLAEGLEFMQFALEVSEYGKS